MQGSASHPRDWERLLRDFLGEDEPAAAAAALAFSGVIQGSLHALGAYQRRASWEDLIHDLLLALFEKGHTVQHPAAWLRRSTYNAYVDWIRREQVRSTAAPLVGHTLQPPAEALLLEQSVTRKEELEELREAVCRLPGSLRAAVDAVYPADPGREPCTLRDAARGLGVELHTLKNRLRQAIESLGREMRRERNLRRFRTRRPHEGAER